MNTTCQLLTAILLGALLFSCEKDNYDPPSARLTGRLLYQGEPIYVEYDRVSYELYQDGFGKTGPLGSTFTPEGEFSQLLFDGEYKMIIPIGQGPFIPLRNSVGAADTLLVDLRGSEEIEVEVTPYWMIRNPQFRKGEQNSISGTFSLEQIATGENAREIESATLYVSKTTFANSQTNVATASIVGGDIPDMNNVALRVGVPELQPIQNYVFASIGVKFVDVEDLIFSPTQRVDL